jgi:hypothetical protein
MFEAEIARSALCKIMHPLQDVRMFVNACHIVNSSGNVIYKMTNCFV